MSGSRNLQKKPTFRNVEIVRRINERGWPELLQTMTKFLDETDDAEALRYCIEDVEKLIEISETKRIEKWQREQELSGIAWKNLGIDKNDIYSMGRRITRHGEYTQEMGKLHNIENMETKDDVYVYNSTDGSVRKKYKGGLFMEKYVCVCGYVYDPGLGDPDNGVAPGTSFADMPEDWACPICGAGKDAFEKE